MSHFNRYYQDELAFLRELGREFAKANPDAAAFLAEPGSDPDVERLLEGTAFLTGRIRQKLDDELPEVTHALIDALFPHYLRPLPAMTMIQFSPAPTQRETIRVPAGAALDALPLDGTACRFRTVWPVAVSPLRIEKVTAEPGPPMRLRIDLRLPAGATFASLGLGRLRLHLGGETAAARALHMCLVRHQGITAELAGQPLVPENGAPGLSIAAVGFAEDEALLPHPGEAGDAHRLLHEWFAFPAKFHAIDLLGLDTMRLPAELGSATISVLVTCAAHARHVPPLSPASLLLHCTPAVNLFAATGEPITLDRTRSEHRLRPAGIDPRHVEVFAVTDVEGRARGVAEAIPYRRRLHLGRGVEAEAGTFQERRRAAVTDDGVDVDLLISEPPPSSTPSSSTALSGASSVKGPTLLSTRLLCTNRQLPMHLGLGDVRLATRDLPAGVTFANLTVPTAAVSPVLAGDLHWRLLSHLILDYGTVLSVDGLRGLLALYDVRALTDQAARLAHQRLVESLVAVRFVRATRYLEGIPIRGLAVTIELDDERLGGIGEAQMIGTILDGFIACFVSMNAFTRLSVLCRQHGEVLTWPDRLGRRLLL